MAEYHKYSGDMMSTLGGGGGGVQYTRGYHKYIGDIMSISKDTMIKIYCAMKISMLDETKLRPALKSSWHNKSNVERNCCPISVLLHQSIFRIMFKTNCGVLDHQFVIATLIL